MRCRVIVGSMLVAALMFMPAAASGQVVWDNGAADGVSGWRPSANWDPIGVVDDLNIPSNGQSAINFFHIEQIDGTTDDGVPSVIDAARIRLYGPLGGGLEGIDIDNDTPVFDHTYTEASGEMIETDTGMNLFGRDLVFFDLLGPSTGTLAAGQYGLFLTYPGQPDIDSFWATASGLPDGGGTETGAVIGPDGVFARLPHQMSFRTEIPEPASLALLGMGFLALIRRR